MRCNATVPKSGQARAPYGLRECVRPGGTYRTAQERCVKHMTSDPRVRKLDEDVGDGARVACKHGLQSDGGVCKDVVYPPLEAQAVHPLICPVDQLWRGTRSNMEQHHV